MMSMALLRQCVRRTRHHAPRTLLFVLLAGCVAAAWPRRAAAYHLEEHLQLGQTAYSEVCRELLSKDLKPPLQPLERQRLEEVACENYESRAIHYGQYVGLAADHIAAENLGSLHGDLDAENLATYLKLAVDDADHFFPGNLRRFEREHDHALELALEAASPRARDEGWMHVRILYWLAFYRSAFADHFLQDAFAPGHGSFNRPASTPAASRIFHNTLNREGLVLRDGVGRIWAAYGDGLLNFQTPNAPRCPFKGAGPSSEGRLYREAADAPEELVKLGHDRGAFLAQAAERASVRDFILTFVTGSRSPPRERAVALRLPANCLGAASVGCTTEQTILRRIEKDQQLLKESSRLADCSLAEQRDRTFEAYEQELERCWRTAALDACASRSDAFEVAAKALSDAYKGDLPVAMRPAEKSDSREDSAAWVPLIAAMDPARLRYGAAVSGIYQPRLGVGDQVLGAAVDFRTYALLGFWGPMVGYYTNFSDSGAADKGLLLGLTVGVPLGLKYGSVLSWEAYFRPTVYMPLAGDRRVGFAALPLGVQLGLQVVSVTLGVSAAASPSYGFQTGPAARDLGWALGVETGLSLRCSFGLLGGGLKSAPPF